MRERWQKANDRIVLPVCNISVWWKTKAANARLSVRLGDQPRSKVSG